MSFRRVESNPRESNIAIQDLVRSYPVNRSVSKSSTRLVPIYCSAKTMKILLMILTSVWVLFSASCAHRPSSESLTPAKSIADTTWVGTDSDGDYYENHFQKDGSLHYKSPTGFWKNGTWRQDGEVVYFEMNRGYSEYDGRMSGKLMEGTGKNIKGHRWTWKLKQRFPNPEGSVERSRHRILDEQARHE